MLNEELKKAILKKCLLDDYGYTDEEAEEEANNYLENYLILTDEEAEEEAIESIKNTLEDCGYNCLNLNLSYYLDENFFKEIFEEHYLYYIEDIEEEGSIEYDNRLVEEMAEAGVESKEDYLDYLLNSINDYIEEYIFQYGEDNLNAIIKEHPECIDIDTLIDDILNCDGRGSTLSSYDGVEHEIKLNNNFYYVYKLN